MSESEPTERLADALIGAVPNLAPGEQAVAVALLRLLAKGAPVSDRASFYSALLIWRLF